MLRRLAIGLFVLLLSSGCAAMKAYEGPELPRSEIAELRELHQHGVSLDPLDILYLMTFPVGTKHVTSIIEIDKKA